MPKRSSKQKDTQELARSILDQIVPDAEPPKEKNPAAVALGRLGGLKGGLARAKKLSQLKRVEIAKKAAQTRWERKRNKQKK
jgi:ABC-type phosphate/phosphonate transport system ATPase subunit